MKQSATAYLLLLLFGITAETSGTSLRRYSRELNSGPPPLDKFVLLDANENFITEITDGMTTAKDQWPTEGILIYGLVSEDDNVTKSVQFDINGDIVKESNAPYSVFGTSDAGNLATGEYILTGTTYDKDRAKGNAGPSLTVTFTVVDTLDVTNPSEGLVPVLVEDWERIPDYPVDVGEAQGAMVEDDLVIVGGFLPDFITGAKETYMLNLKDHYDGKNVGWVKMDDCPVDAFLTHAAHAVKGTQLFLCGGYRGANPGPEMKECYVFDKSKSAGNQWEEIASLPAGRGGGAMVYVESMNALVFALGAERPEGLESTFDKPDVYMLDLSNPDAIWVELATGPYEGNHVSAVDAKDCDGDHHYYWLGGQIEENEQSGNLDMMYEYIPESDTWEARASIPQGTGHVTSSTVPFGCGFVIVGGAVDGDDLNRRIKTDEVYYYDIPTDQWSFLGSYEKVSNTPVCGIYSDKLYCTSGYRVKGWRSTITYTDVTSSTASPSSLTLPQPPSPSPSTLPLSPAFSAQPSLSPVPPSQSLGDAIRSVTLYNVNSGDALLKLEDGMEIDFATLGGVPLSIKAFTFAETREQVSSMHFELVAPLVDYSHIENTPPYTLNGSKPFEFQTFVGYTLTVTPYSENDLNGISGTPVTISFSFV